MSVDLTPNLSLAIAARKMNVLLVGKLPSAEDGGARPSRAAIRGGV